MSNITPFTNILAQLNNGELNDELTAQFAEIVKGVREKETKGVLTISLIISPINEKTEDRIKITPKIKTKLPEFEHTDTIVVSTEDGDVIFDNVDQI